MRTLVIIMLWVYRRQIAGFVRCVSHAASDAWRRTEAQRDAEAARARDYAGPHGGFDANSRRPF